MTKRIFTLLMMILVCVLAVGCSEEYTVDYDAMPEEEATVRKAADKALLQEYGFDGVYHCEVKLDKYPAKEHYMVRYKLTPFGHNTPEHYTVYVGFDGTVQDVSGSNVGEYSYFLPELTESKVKNAAKKLDKQVEKYTNHDIYYFSVAKDGSLQLSCEVITYDVAPDNLTAHKHLMFYEKVCDKPD